MTTLNGNPTPKPKAPAANCPRCTAGRLIFGARIAVCGSCGFVLGIAELP